MMKIGFATLALISVAVCAFAGDTPQPNLEVKEFAPGGSLRIRFRAGDLRVVRGTDASHLRLSYTAKRSGKEAGSEVRERFEVLETDARLDLSAPNNVELDVEVQVPSPVSLKVRMLAGDLTVEGLEGNKDLENHFGDVVLKHDSEKNYGLIEVSARVGDVSGFPGELHGLLGKSGDRRGGGRYRLHAHVGAGDVRLGLE